MLIKMENPSGGGGATGAYGYRTSISANQTVDINDLGFEPRVIILVATGANSSEAYTFWYDSDYSTSQQWFCGQGYGSWQTFAFPATGSSMGFTETNPNGFKFSSGSYSINKIDYVAIP